MSWGDWLDLVATILFVWMVVALGILIGKCAKHSRGFDEESSPEG